MPAFCWESGVGQLKCSIKDSVTKSAIKVLPEVKGKRGHLEESKESRMALREQD